MNDCKRLNNKTIALLIMIVAMLTGLLSPVTFDESLSSLEEFNSITGGIHAVGGFSNHDTVINMAASDRNALAIIDRRPGRTGSDRATSLEYIAICAASGAQSYSLLQHFYRYAVVAGFLYISLIFIYYIHLSDGQK